MKIFRILSIAAILAAGTLSCPAQVKVWQGTLDLPTYEEGLPDPNPPFDQLTTGRFNYPYTLRTNLTDKRTIRHWRAVFLENEYLKCSVLPDLGGHLYTCIDKVNGQPMFYANPSIKKANIGYRGAWAAFGDEFNFPVSHNWMSLSPIDFSFGQESDGSASVTVGNVDRVYGMQWSVQMLLRPKSTVLEQRVTLYNRSDVRHRFYWWNNAGVQIWDDSHIEYPMRFVASHGFTEVQPWPVDSSGKDLSIIHNQTDGPVSVFVHGSREPFMGVWNPHSNSGTVHFADYDALPGKKVWSWGVDADGLDWRKALSDNNSAYAEVQGGLFRNQETYAFLEPRQTIHFSEYWMPVRGIGAITRANLNGVLALRREGNDLLIGFNANHPVRSAAIVVSAGGKPVWAGHADLTPQANYSQRVPVGDATECTVEIRDGSGAVLLNQTEGRYDWTPVDEIKVGPKTSYKIPSPAARSEDDFLQLGKTQELDGELLSALQTYSDLLTKNQQSYEGLKADGRLSVTLLRYADAVHDLEQARSRNTTDAEVAYYLGAAYDGLNMQDKARTAFETAYRLPEWRAAAAIRLAELAARENDLATADRYLTEALQGDTGDARAAEELVAVENVWRKSDARERMTKMLRQFPLSYFLREENGQSDLQQLANDSSRILNLASEYMRLGLYKKALDVLSRPYPQPAPEQSEPGTTPAANNPMLAYYRAYCREKLGQPAADDYKAALSQPSTYIFPSSGQDLAVLAAAIKSQPDDAQARYLLGTLDFSKGLTDEALQQWSEAKKSSSHIPVLDASMGIALLHEKHDADSALRAFEDGIRNDPRNETVYFGADQALSILGRPAADRVHALGQYPDQANMPSGMVFELALNLAESGDFDRATALFHDRFFAREEGGTNVRQVWVEVQLLGALDKAKRGQCDQGVEAARGLGRQVPGVSFTSDGLDPFVNSARTNYELGELYRTCKMPDEAAQHYKSAAGKSGSAEVIWAWLASKQLPGFEPSQWTSRLEAALRQTDATAESSSFSGWWIYSHGMLNRALSREQEADRDFRKVFLLSDRLLSYHLARQAMAAR